MNLKDILKSRIVGSVALGLTTAFDSVSTYFCVEKFGIEVEKNPIVKWFIENQQVINGLIEKDILGTSLLMGTAYYLYRKNERQNKKTILGEPINYLNFALYSASAGRLFCAVGNTIKFISE